MTLPLLFNQGSTSTQKSSSDTLLVKITEAAGNVVQKTFSSQDSLLVKTSETLGDRVFGSTDVLKIKCGEVGLEFIHSSDSLLLVGYEYSYDGPCLLTQAQDVLLLAGGGIDSTVYKITNTFLSPCSDALLILGELDTTYRLSEYFISTDTLLIEPECDLYAAFWVDPPDPINIKISDSTSSLIKREWGVDLFLKTSSDTLSMKIRDNYTELWTVYFVIPFGYVPYYSWTVPAGITRILVMCVGPGGCGGGGGLGTPPRMGQGGGGGQCGQVVMAYRTVSPGQVIKCREANRGYMIRQRGMVGSPNGMGGPVADDPSTLGASYFDIDQLVGSQVVAKGGQPGEGGRGEQYSLDLSITLGGAGTDNDNIPEVPPRAQYGSIGGGDGSGNPGSGGQSGAWRDYWIIGDGHFDQIAVGGGGGGGSIDGLDGGDGGYGAQGAVIIFTPVIRICSEDLLNIKTTEQPTLINGKKQIGTSDTLLVKTSDVMSYKRFTSTDSLTLKVNDDPQGRMAVYSSDSLKIKVLNCNSKRAVSSPGTITLTSSTSWTVPPGATSVTVELVGGGGGGGAGGCGQWMPGGTYPYGHGGFGGSAGTKKTGQILVTVPGAILTVIVGNGGGGGWGSTPYVYSGAAGSPGGTSSIGTITAPGGDGGSGGPGPFNDSPTSGTTGANGPSPGISATSGMCGSYHYFWNGGNPYYQCMGGPGGPAGSGYGSGGGGGGGGTGYYDYNGNQGGPGGAGSGGYVKLNWNETTNFITSCDSLAISLDETTVKKILNYDTLKIKSEPENSGRGFIGADSLKVKDSEITNRNIQRMDDLFIKTQETTAKAFISLDSILMKFQDLAAPVTCYITCQDALKIKVPEISNRAFMREDSLLLKVNDPQGVKGLTGLDQLLLTSLEERISLDQWTFSEDDLSFDLEDLGVYREISCSDELNIRVEEIYETSLVYLGLDELIISLDEKILDRTLGATDSLQVGLVDGMTWRHLTNNDPLIITLEDPSQVVYEFWGIPNTDTLALKIQEVTTRTFMKTDLLKIKGEDISVKFMTSQDTLKLKVREKKTHRIENRSLRFISSGGTRAQSEGTFKSSTFLLLPEDP